MRKNKLNEKKRQFALLLFETLRKRGSTEKSNSGPFSSFAEKTFDIGGHKITAWWSRHLSGIEEKFLEVIYKRKIVFRVFVRERFLISAENQRLGIETLKITKNVRGTRNRLEKLMQQSERENKKYHEKLKKLLGRFLKRKALSRKV